MRPRVLLATALVTLAAIAPCAGPARGEAPAGALEAPLAWRPIGPLRGGRTVAGVGVPGDLHRFYIGVGNGGVWTTANAGRTWTPIFDAQPTASIGALALAPSDPRTLYVGSGEGLQRPDLSVGDGVYRSTDAGATWTHLGLRGGQQIPALAVDPRDARRVYAAVLGAPYGASAERGVFRSDDGGEHWRRVLFVDEDTGAMDVRIDPASPQTLYAVTWAARQAPWEIDDSWTLSGRNALWKSSDGGEHWRRIGAGLPDSSDGLGRIGIALAPSRPARLYAVVGARRHGGLYRSEDGGEHWRLVDADPRLWDRDGDFNEVEVDPRDPDRVVVANVVTWRSRDGGATFDALRGAPGGDDYHRVWISPDDARVMLLVGDQGALVTLDDGVTWSSWYNQPTAQMFHVAADDGFPYRLYGGQQESGSAGVSSRGDDGRITFRDWHPVGVEEYGYAVPDPLDPNLVYGGKLSRYDRRTGDAQDVSPDPLRRGDWRWVRTMPVVFSPADPHALYLGANVVFETRDGARTWRTISPDLTRAAPAVPPSLGAFTALDPEQGRHRGVVYALAPSPRAANLVWAGTDDGLVHVTHDDGATWHDVTPPGLSAWSKISGLEASHFDTLVAYAAVNRFRLDDLKPHIWRTRDGGRTWRETVSGIDTSEVVNMVREDPRVPGLLYAATERGVWWSADDGDQWRSLRRNLPATSVRDLVVHDDDLAIATHGRGFWILDDVTPLRQMADAAASADLFLFAPAPAVRVRDNRNTDTPLPPDEPGLPNPPEGAIVDYALARTPRGPVTLEVLDAGGALVRRYASTDAPDTAATEGNTPGYWMRETQPLPATAGLHRVVWDLHATPPPGPRRSFGMAATPRDTPRGPRGPFVAPGHYTLRLTADGVTRTRTLEVRPDPRVPTPPAELARTYALSSGLVALLRADSLAQARAAAVRTRLGAARAARAASAAVLDSLDASLGALTGAQGGGRGSRGAGAATLGRIAGQAGWLFSLIERSDAPPTPALRDAAETLERDFAGLLARLDALERSAARNPPPAR